MKTDMQLHQGVLAELTWDPKITEKEIAISAMGGVVTLSGSVTSYAEKVAAELAVERVAGVAAIANDIVVDPVGASPRPDTEIAHRIVEAFAWDIEVPHDGITAKVTNGWVTLEGEVEWQYQRDAAARTVRYLAGVRGLTNALRVRPSVQPGDVSASIKQTAEGAARGAPGVTEVRDQLAVVF